MYCMNARINLFSILSVFFVLHVLLTRSVKSGLLSFILQY